MAGGTQLVDTHTTIDHALPHNGSHELYKGILGGKGRGVFNGKIIVRQDAQKTDAKQTNKALLLSDGAQIDTKPQLEIFADDVKCTHGATVGQLDPEMLFYLQARGIARRDARGLLIRGSPATSSIASRSRRSASGSINRSSGYRKYRVSRFRFNRRSKRFTRRVSRGSTSS